MAVISGAHMIIYTKDAEADRAFFRDVLSFPSIDAGGGWLIFGLPPSEIALHPAAENGRHEIYLTCSDLEAVMGDLHARRVECSPVEQQPWGALTYITLPGGGKLGLYQPRHPLAPRVPERG